jgi:two-component system response regulator DesR
MLAEDVRILRETLTAVLELEDDLVVVAAVGRGDEVLAMAAEFRPDVVVLDIDLPEMDGLTAAHLLRDRMPDCRTLMLTGMARPGYLRRALAADVSGFLLKHSPPDELIGAIRKVAAGERVVDPQLALAALSTA